MIRALHSLEFHEKLQGYSYCLTFPNKDANLSLRSLSVRGFRYRAFILVHISFQENENLSYYPALSDFLNTMQLKIKCGNPMITTSCKNE